MINMINGIIILKPGYSDCYDDLLKELERNNISVVNHTFKVLNREVIEHIYDNIRDYYELTYLDDGETWAHMCDYMCSEPVHCLTVYVDGRDHDKKLKMFKEYFRGKHKRPDWEDYKNVIHTTDAKYDLEYELRNIFLNS